MNVQKGKHQVGQAPGYHPQQRFPHGPAENQSFHVSTGGAFPGQSAGVPGAGAGPGSQQIRTLPMAPLPPPTQQAPHPQPPPTPTSTPPASDMGKPTQIPQNNINMTFVQNTQRTQNNQQYYSPRISPPTNPRMATATARGQVINIPNLQIPYSGGGGNLVNVTMHHPSFLMAPVQQMQPSQFQTTRQHAPANHQYYQQVASAAGMLHPAYQSVLQPSSAPYYSASPNFYMQQSGNAGQYAGNVPLQRFGNANQTLPPAQAGPQPGVGMHTQQQTIVSQQAPQQQTTQRSQKKRDKAIPIIDPVSGKDVLEEYVDNSSKSNSSVKSTHSNESSARETPLPGGASHENDLHASSEQQQVRAKFAAMVAAVATTNPEQTSSQQSIPEVVNGPEISEPEITQTVPSSDSVKSSKLSSNVEEFTSMSQSSDIVKESTGHNAGPPMHSHGQTMQTPVVSALTGGEVQPNWQTNHGREQFPALKTAPPPTVSINTVSPVKNNTRKQTRVNSESEKIPQQSLEKPSQQPPPHSQPPPQPQQTPQVVSSATTINPVIASAERDTAAAPTAVLVPGQKKEKNAPSKPVPSNANKEDVPVTNQHPPSKERREKGQRAVVKETPPQAQQQQQPPQPVEPTPQPQHQPHKLSFTESISIKSVNQSSLSMSSIPALSQTTVTPSTNTVPTPAAVAEEKPAPAPVQPAQQTNGETPVESSDGKASQRQGHKKNKKMKDNINRKGVEKEGTEMDAFTDSNPEEKEKSTPNIPATINNPLPLSNKTAVNEKITKDELEDKIVAAKNEENAKVSALPKTEEDVSPAPIIEKSQPTPQQTVMLKHKYQDDQWSPVNPDGKKKYGRDFLLDLQNEPQSMKKPVNLPNLEVVLQDHTNRRIGSQSFSNYSSSSRGGHDFIPPFLKSGGGSISRGGQIPNRKSQQGTKGGKGSSKAGVMHISLSLKDDVKLRETENAWKPARFSSKDVTEEDKKTQELYKKMRSILNKLTPQKFHTLVNQVKALPIDTVERLRGVINLVFDKAIDEPGFAKAYAEMCKVVADKEVLISREDNSSNENSENENNAKKASGNAVGFRKLLLTRCQHEFERNKIAELNSEKRLQEIKVCTDPEKKKELQLNYEEEERQVRRKSVGNTKFIGELYILGMLTGPIMHRCINQLLKTHEEEPLECLCKLLTTIGKDLEQEKTSNLPRLDPYFDKMKELAQKRENSKISSRVRFMLQDVIELRQNKWVPRRDDNNPKTIDQIQRDADRESLEMSLALNSAPRKQDARFNDNDRKGRNSRGGNMNQNDDGWTSVQSNKGFRPSHSYQIEAARFHSFKQQPETTNTLGSGSQFTVWSRGAKTNQISAESKPDNRVTVNNMYSLLISKDRDGDKKHSNMMSSRSGKITPSPSIEKERMICGLKEAMDSDRQSHRIQQSSQPPSRDRTPTPARVNPASVPSTPAPASLPPLTTEEIQRKAKLIIEEYMCNNNYEETQQNLEDLLGRSVNEVLLEMLLLSVNISPNNASGRTSVGKLFAHLIGNQFLSQTSVVSVFEKLCEQIINDDIEVDVPHIWKFFAELVAPLISSDKFSFNDLHKICTPLDGNCKGILLPLFQILNQECGETAVRNKWTASRLQISDFCDASNPAVQKATEFLTRRGDSSSPVIPSPSLSMEEIEKKLTNLLQNDKEYEDIVKWVNAHVGSKREKDPQFIRALMTAICESSINSNKKLLEQSFSKNTKLISRYVDSIEELEIQCLCAIQTYTTKLEHPSGLLLKIFNYLWENGKISNDAFIKWRDSDTLEAGKGVAVKSLTSFFTALTEGEISDEAS